MIMIKTLPLYFIAAIFVKRKKKNSLVEETSDERLIRRLIREKIPVLPSFYSLPLD